MSYKWPPVIPIHSWLVLGHHFFKFLCQNSPVPLEVVGILQVYLGTPLLPAFTTKNHIKIQIKNFIFYCRLGQRRIPYNFL
jgi:hypothetical protein